MSKSILVIDTPDDCNECELHALTECDYDKEFYCAANGENVEEFVCSKTKPDRCPLRDLPEKKPRVKYHGNGCFGINEAMKNSFNLGFNACIDEILKGANGNE